MTAAPPSAPFTVFLNITNRCNLRCKHCSASAGAPWDNELRTDEMLALIHQMAELKIFKIYVTGGEPLTRPDFFEIADAIDCGRFAWTLNSNGTLVDAGNAERLAAYRFLKGVAVSLDGPTAEVNDGLRGRGAFQKAIRGIEQLRQHGLGVNISSVLTRLNADHVVDMVHLAHDLGVDGIAFNSLHPVGRLNLNQQALMLRPGQTAAVAQRLLEIQGDHPGFVHNDLAGWIRLYQQDPPQGGEPRHLLPCSAAKDACAIRPDGAVIPCNAMWDLVAGNVRHEDLATIWHTSPELQQVRDLAELTVDRVSGCKGCKYVSLCSGGCRADAWLATGSLMGHSPTCWLDRIVD
jgi:SynChlorMet cassette radical SAM/SPASM protein ScmE